jgi:hypothetical protein
MSARTPVEKLIERNAQLHCEVTRLGALNAKLLNFAQAYVRLWEQSFKGQDTGYDGTELEDFYKQGKKLIASNAPREVPGGCWFTVRGRRVFVPDKESTP